MLGVLLNIIPNFRFRLSMMGQRQTKHKCSLSTDPIIAQTHLWMPDPSPTQTAPPGSLIHSTLTLIVGLDWNLDASPQRFSWHRSLCCSKFPVFTWCQLHSNAPLHSLFHSILTLISVCHWDWDIPFSGPYDKVSFTTGFFVFVAFLCLPTHFNWLNIKQFWPSVFKMVVILLGFFPVHCFCETKLFWNPVGCTDTRCPLH